MGHAPHPELHLGADAPRPDQMLRPVVGGGTNMFAGVDACHDHDVVMELHDHPIPTQGIDSDTEGSR